MRFYFLETYILFWKFCHQKNPFCLKSYFLPKDPLNFVIQDPYNGIFDQKQQIYFKK